ncbi:MAG: SprT-like domain-containing protein [Bacteroidota bacterium]
MRGEEYELRVFQKFVPKEAAAYCHKLWNENGFEIKIVKGRNTKLGDFRYDPEIKKYAISVNNNLNSYAFLITYIHEVAHYFTYLKYKNAVKPHGEEWKQMFKKLLVPMIQKEIFPDSVQKALSKHLRNPKAATCSDPDLYKALKTFDVNGSDIQLLSHLKSGEAFRFNGRDFKKISKRRTRSLCSEIKTGKQYLIPEIAEIEKLG